MNKRQTVGKVAYDLLHKVPDTRDPRELEQAMHGKYEQIIKETCVDGKRKYTGDFYIVCLLRKEPFMPNVIRSLVHHRKSCPTPNYDQTVYRYSREDDELFFLWTLPDRETALIFKENALNIVCEEKALRDFIIDFYDGTLDKLCYQLNGEKPDIILYKKE